MTLSVLDPNAALVLIDLQRGIVGRAAAPVSPAEVVAQAVLLANAFRDRDLLVVLVRVTMSLDGKDVTPGRTEFARSGGSPPEGWDEIVDELSGHPSDVVVSKRNWSAFYGTDLDLQLRRRGVTQIVLAGISTSIGVESTARSAFEHGYHVVLVTDAMTDTIGEAHVNSVERIFPRLGETTTTPRVVELLAVRAAG